MSLTNTDIQFKRSKHTLDELNGIQLNFAEPLFIDNLTHDSEGKITAPYKAYLVVGRKPDEEAGEETASISAEKSPVFKAFSRDIVDNLVFYNAEDGSITNESGDQVAVNRLTTINKTINDLSIQDVGKYYILCQRTDNNQVYKFTLDDFGIFINGRGVLTGAAWNDYAELREISGDALPGQVVCDQGDGTVALSNKLYQPCAHVVSDTFGHLIGEKKEGMVPIAVAGRVLVALDSSIAEGVEVGDCVCAGLNGLAHKMTRQEIINYPDRIIGTVCEIPKDNFIGSIEVDGRIWINVK